MSKIVEIKKEYLIKILENSNKHTGDSGMDIIEYYYILGRIKQGISFNEYSELLIKAINK